MKKRTEQYGPAVAQDLAGNSVTAVPSVAAVRTAMATKQSGMTGASTVSIPNGNTYSIDTGKYNKAVTVYYNGNATLKLPGAMIADCPATIYVTILQGNAPASARVQVLDSNDNVVGLFANNGNFTINYFYAFGSVLTQFTNVFFGDIPLSTFTPTDIRNTITGR
jgi:hypothetical protein